MGTARKKAKTHVITSKKQNKVSSNGKERQDVISKLDGLRSSVKTEHAKVDRPTTSKNYQIMAVVLIVVVGSAGLIVL